jgi:hypothetical protein
LHDHPALADGGHERAVVAPASSPGEDFPIAAKVGPMTSTRNCALAAVLALALSITGCTGNSDGEAESTDPTPSVAKDGPLALKGVCPDRIVVMTPWFPEAELGQVYQLLGPGYEVDAAKKRVIGKLVAGGTDTGVELEVRAGGPAVGFQQVSAQMYQDKSITLGMPPLDELAQLSARQPTLAVVAPLEADPLAIGWDPQKHPDLKTIRDIGQTDTKVLAYSPDAAMDYMIGSGILKRSQVDGSFDGSPARFVASQGEVATVMFVTNEPYTYEHELKAWGKPLKFQLVNDAGYPNYRNVVTIRTADKDKLAPCLKKLVPIIQQAQLDFVDDPKSTIDVVLKANDAYKAGFVYSRGNAEYSARMLKELRIVSNGKDQTLGNFDEERVQRIIDITKPIFAAQKIPMKKDLKPGDMVTNEFVDTNIAYKP